MQSSAAAKRAGYDGAAWSQSSLDVLRALEAVGVSVTVTGIEQVERLAGPCVFIGNHVSTLETMVLPCIIQPVKEVTFIVKQSLLDYPVFKHVMRSRNPIAVSRLNPRDDLKAVLEGGLQRLQAGRSLVVFPQTTRTTTFQPAEFNTMGIKLARKAGVPVVPLALLTDAWRNGNHFKDFGKIDPAKHVYFAFGKPLRIQDRGSEEHAAIMAFIGEQLQAWRT